MAAPKQDSNRTGLFIAEEESLKVLPGVNGANAVWRAQEPNSYSDFGGELSLVARAPINPSRQQQKGGIVDMDASGGYNQDFTQSNFQRLLQGFFFADAREKVRNVRLSVETANDVVSITAGQVLFAEELTGIVPVGGLVLLQGFASPLNNGLKVVSAADADSVTVGNTADDADPLEGASLTQCGQQFEAGDVSLVITDGIYQLVSTVFDFTTIGLSEGEWIFVGGGAVANRFTNNIGYARVSAIEEDALTFDKVSWANYSAEDGAGKTIQIFFGTFIRNEKDPDLIVRRSYSLERTLGRDDDGQQAEYLDGAVPNEFTLNIPQADKLNADLTFVAVDNAQRTGLEGLRPGVRVAAPGEGLVNTSSNVVRLRMSIADPANPNPAPFFAYITEGTLGINNGITPDKAVGVLGAFDVSADDFVVSGDVTAYFSTVEAVRAVRNNADVSIDMIFAANGAGFVFDIPLLALGGGRLNVEKGQSINLPLEMSAAENKFGYTLGVTFFDYLPSVAIPS